MNKLDFERNRKDHWTRFEHLLVTAERFSLKKMPGKEINEFSRLFRETAGDLATVRSRGWGERLESYLNHLVSRGHNAFYRAPPGGVSKLLEFLASGYPRLFRANIVYLAVACLLFFGPYLATWIMVQSDPGMGARIVPQPVLDGVARMYDFDADQPRLGGFSEERSRMAGFYVLNNGSIALQTFVGGIFFGVVSVYLMLHNGLALGTISGYVVSQGHANSFMSFVISHGAFELTAIAVAGAAGLMLGHALVHPHNRSRLESLRVRGTEAVQIAAGAAVMIGIAAAIEAFWSPAPVKAVFKYIVGCILWVLVILYFSLAGRGR